ncbi:MAG TPA: hypothetical protein PLQ13_06915 [Candidatus Krumholzibacteria bacterium]|nr:hypothetical protein [Candidatus Krumholzibacteria bacterium]
MKHILGICLLGTMLALAGCGGDGSSTPTTPPPPDGTNTLFDAVKLTVPAFTATTSAAKTGAIADPAMMAAFQLLRNYTYPDDEGRVDMSNIYKVMWETGGHLEEAPYRCSGVPAAADAAITCFAFNDLLGHAYTFGMSEESGGYGVSIAYATSGNEKRMLCSYKWAPEAAEQICIGVIQAAYDAVSGDISIRFAQAVQYPPGSMMGGAEGNGFALRAEIDGNSATHAFELKMANNTTSLVGQGVSRGAGNHFLFRCGDAYYSVPAEATEDDLAALTPTDLAGVPDVCAAYKEAVSAMTPFDVNTDLPSVDLGDFDHGAAGTPVRYLLF